MSHILTDDWTIFMNISWCKCLSSNHYSQVLHTKFMLSKSLNKIIKSEMQTACCLFFFCRKKFSKLNMKYFFYDQINNIRCCKTKCFFHNDRMTTKTPKCMCVCQFTRLWKYFDLNLHVKPQKESQLLSWSRFFRSPMVSSNDEHDNV